MELTINKGDMVEVLAKIQGLTGRKTNLAITENILIRAAGSQITLMATDLETGFEGSYPAVVAVPGTISINAKKLYEIIRNLPTDEIRITEVENRWIEIVSKNSQYHIVGMNPDDHPDQPLMEEVTFFPMECAGLKDMIEKCVGVTGDATDKRAHITGVYFERITDGEACRVRMVSTDGSRLSKVDKVLSDGATLPEGEGIIIPKKGLVEVGKFLDTVGMAEVGIKDNHLVIRKDSETITIRLLEGDFPRYQEIIILHPQYNRITLEKLPFLMMLRRMSILSTETYKGVIFNLEGNRLLITATNPDIGEAKEDMEISPIDVSIETAFNPRFFIDALNAIDEDRIIFNMWDAEHPCLIHGEQDESYISVIMPMKI